MSISKLNNPPTEKMINMLKIISEFIKNNGYSPTVRELCDLSLLKSTSTVHQYLDRLESRELILRTPTANRTIRITDKGKEVLDNDK